MIDLTKPWLECRTRVPFRAVYAFLDNLNGCVDPQFEREAVNVRWKLELAHVAHPQYHLFFITCRKKDKSKVERALTRLSQRLETIDAGYWDAWEKVREPFRKYAAEAEGHAFNEEEGYKDE